MNKTLAAKVVGICLIFLLIGVFVGYGAAPSLIQTISSGVVPGAPSYTVYEVGGVYYAKDQNGYNEFSDLSFSTVGTSAAASGGHILFKGDFIADDCVYIPSNTVIELDGTWTLEDMADKHLLQNSDFEGGNENIEVFGGVWDGNKDNQPELTPETAVFMTRFSNVDGIKIHDLTLQNFLSDGIHIRNNSINSVVSNIIAYGCVENAICIIDAENTAVNNVVLYDNANGLSVGHSADEATSGYIASNVISYENSVCGAWVINSYNVSITGRFFNNANGIVVQRSKGINIDVNSEFNYANGVQFVDVDYFSIEGFAINNNQGESEDGQTYNGIICGNYTTEGSCKYGRISMVACDNQVTPTQKRGVFIDGYAEYVVAFGCVANGNDYSQLWTDASDSYVNFACSWNGTSWIS